MKILVFFLIVILFSSCVKNPTGVSQEMIAENVSGVYVLNEGNFGRGNSEISFYNFNQQKIYNNIFYNTNHKNLGDVGNEIEIRDSLGYIVVNNSHKIEIININSNINIATINIGQNRSPRQMEFLNDSIALVTNLYDNSVLVLNVFQKSILKRIQVGNNPEGIAIFGNKCFVANSGLGNGNTISILDLENFEVRNTLKVGDNPVEIKIDNDGEVYVLCAGKYNSFTDTTDDTWSKIFIVSPTTEKIIDSIFIGDHSFKMVLTNNDNGFACGEKNILQINTLTNKLIGNFFSGKFYSIAYDEINHNLYLSDAKNYIQNGTIKVISILGQFRNSFDVGINPSSFAFKK